MHPTTHVRLLHIPLLQMHSGSLCTAIPRHSPDAMLYSNESHFIKPAWLFSSDLSHENNFGTGESV